MIAKDDLFRRTMRFCPLRATQNRIDDTNARIVKYIKKYTDERDFVPEYIGPNILTPEGDAPEL
jgi:hypothetical protein